jgi:catechol 2,3-dioxygenase-like lactoylglutathione lyase family enzyme
MATTSTPKENHRMITRLNVASIYVLDKEEALDFYVNKLGLEKGNDVRQGDYRWLTIRVPGQPGIEVSLEQPGAPLHDEATAEQLRELITKGALGGLVFITDDAHCPLRDAQGTRRHRLHAGAHRTISTARTWASAIRSATRSGSSSRARPPRRRPPDHAHRSRSYDMPTKQARNDDKVFSEASGPRWRRPPRERKAASAAAPRGTGRRA